MIRNAIQRCADYLWVDCRDAESPEIEDACCALSRQCLDGRLNRVLLHASGADTLHSLRNAFATMLLAGIPSDYRMAVVTDSPRMSALLGELQSDLLRLGIFIGLFVDDDAAIDWLLRVADTKRIQVFSGRSVKALQ